VTTVAPRIRVGPGGLLQYVARDVLTQRPITGLQPVPRNVVELPITPPPQELILSPALETDTAQPISFTQAQNLVLAPALETDTAQAITFSQAQNLVLSPALETDTAQAISLAQVVPLVLAPAVETDAAQAIAFAQAQSLVLSPALETDVAQAITLTLGSPAVQELILFPAVEIDAAQPIVLVQAVVIIINLLSKFPAGVQIEAYRAGEIETWVNVLRADRLATVPPASPVETQTMTASGAVFTELTRGERYFFVAQVATRQVGNPYLPAIADRWAVVEATAD
jgi:hypothetical protein